MTTRAGPNMCDPNFIARMFRSTKMSLGLILKPLYSFVGLFLFFSSMRNIPNCSMEIIKSFRKGDPSQRIPNPTSLNHKKYLFKDYSRSTSSIHRTGYYISKLFWKRTTSTYHTFHYADNGSDYVWRPPPEAPLSIPTQPAYILRLYSHTLILCHHEMMTT